MVQAGGVFWWFGVFWTLLNSNFLNRCSRPEAEAEHSVNGGEAELSPFIFILSKFVFQTIGRISSSSKPLVEVHVS